MADPTRNPSVNETSQEFLETIVSPYKLFIADSKVPGGGAGLFAREELPSGQEVFRATPVVSAV